MPVYVSLGAAVTVVIALWFDLRLGKIPNTLTVASMIGGLVVTGLWGDGLVSALAGAGAGFAVFLIPFMAGGMGGGDIKLFTALGAWLGWYGILMTALFSAIAGGGVALAVLIRNKGEWNGLSQIVLALRTRDLGWLRSSERFPYSLPAAFGLAAFIWFRSSL
jgi:prepilin peptidase CpaA